MLLELLLAVLFDQIFGELRRFHPLVGFGHWADTVERKVRAFVGATVFSGALAWAIAVLPCIAGLLIIQAAFPWWSSVFDVVLLYFALGLKSLSVHARAVLQPLVMGDLTAARQRLSWIVSRDTAQADGTQVAGAASESVLENGSDAVFAAIFWFLLLGGAGVLLYRLSNTLDAMWGYRNARFIHFGRFAARCDDVLNWMPARLTALTYALLGHRRIALQCWKTQAPLWSSPNAGPVMAAGAGSLGVVLGGNAWYHGNYVTRPLLGQGQSAVPHTIIRALHLVYEGVVLWLIAYALLEAVL